MIRAIVLRRVLLIFLVPISNIVYAADCKPWVAKAISIQGDVERRATDAQQTSQWLHIKRDDTLCAGEIIRVKQNSRAALILINDTILRLNQNTTITLSSLTEDQSHWINLEQGIAHFIARIKQSFKVITPFVNAAVEGTEFVVSVTNTQTEVTVFEGNVSVNNSLGEVTLLDGQSAITTKKSIPNLTLKIKPRDAVQWSLYYPAIIDYDSISYQEMDTVTKIIIQKSIAAAKQGQITKALEQLGLINESELNATLFNYRAALYLSVGQIEKAQYDIKQLLQLQPNNVQAISLQAIFAIVQNDKTKALTLAEQASTLEPNNASAVLALSYVHQSLFDINSALTIMKAATTKNKSNALLWSRLSELYLMVGDLDEALKAAQQANELNPNITRTHNAQGFAYLSLIEVQKAKQAFKDAIEIDDTDPLSRLGLGLALIRQGDLSKGRQQIEFAATLDPNNALIRSYLGKAYYEENRNKLAAIQYNMAKQLDPNDPTAFYYDAIRKQRENDTVNALYDLQESIKLNNNRAVYRSSLKLDQDNASRNISVAKIYQDLGFNQLALKESYNSLNQDPSNSSAHRFLADSYLLLPRYEIARASELLQSQLLQPQSLHTIQPLLTNDYTKTHTGSWKPRPSFSEYSSLYSYDKTIAQLDTIFGTNDTFGENIIVSAIEGNTSISVSQAYYKSDGVRDNNDIKLNSFNLFVQSQLSYGLNTQFEYLTQNIKSGDLLQRFYAKDFIINERNDIDFKTGRFGLHYQKNNQHLLTSLIKREEVRVNTTTQTREVVPGFNLSNLITKKENPSAFTVEIQYIYNLNLIVGAGTVDGKYSREIKNLESVIPPGPPIPPETIITYLSTDSSSQNIYFYTYLKPLNFIDLTLGLSHETYIENSTTIENVNPKIGMKVLLADKTILNIAYISSLKRNLVAKQTIEPTQISGFNQIYDDINGSKINNYSISIGYQHSQNLYSELSSNARNINFPIFSGNKAVFHDVKENTSSAYLYYNFNSKTSLSFEYLNENFENKSISPRKLNNQYIRFGFKYLFNNKVSTYILVQKVEQKYRELTAVENNDKFIIVNATIEYLLSNRNGSIITGVKNMFYERFDFYNINLTGQEKASLFNQNRYLYINYSYMFN